MPDCTEKPYVRFKNAWEQANNGESVEGTIDLGDAYLSYDVTEIAGSRYFKIRIGMDDGVIEPPLPPAVREAVALIIETMDETPLPEFGEYRASTKL